MSERINIRKYLGSKGGRAILALGQAVRETTLEPSLLHLVELRASQINGCAFCVDMHTKDARAHGETEQRLYAVSVWRETPFFSQRERAALEWAEAVTRVADSRVPDDVYARARAQFSENELVELTFAIVTTNVFNLLNVSFRTPAGTYQPEAAHA
jgi:AhpD family alkylhydroperoxidase